MKFDERYKIYLDITAQSNWEWDNDTDATWVEVFPSISPFKSSLYEKELFRRYKWGDITFRNEPYLSSELYDTIKNLSLTQEIRIKIVTDNNVIRGYFGGNDCEYNDDDKVVKVTPAILDQYTAILENAEKKIDATGGVRNYSARYDLNTDTISFRDSHKLPIKKVAGDIDEARTPDITKAPILGGAFIYNTKSKYNSTFEVIIDVTLFPTAASRDVTFYLRLYDKFGVFVEEHLLESFASPTVGNKDIYSGYTVEPSLLQNYYVTLEADVSSAVVGLDLMTYNSIELKVALVSLPFNTITIEVGLLKENLTPLQVWTEVKHGRASPKESEWDDTNGVKDYFDQTTGQPLVNGIISGDGRFDDGDFGPKAGAGAVISNDKDMNNETIDGLFLADLITALDTYKYELSSVTVYQGTKYWAGFKRKRRVYSTCTFSRDEYFKADDGDPPPGEGWESTEYFESNKRLWIRKPLNGTVTDWDLGTFDETGGETAGFQWLKKQGTVRNYPNGEESETFNTARTLKEFITTIYNGASELLNGKEVESTFFWNENEADVPFYNASNSGANYVTSFKPNTLNRIACLHTFNLKTDITNSSTEDSLLEMSFNNLMDDLKKQFPDIFWFIEEDGTLRIEHIKYLDEKLKTIDIRNNPLIDETLKWKYDKTLMFETVLYNTINSAYLDFTNNKEEFDKIASNNRNKDLNDQKETEYLSTDVKYCLEARNDLENGILLIAYDENNKMINSEVPIAGSVFENGELALSNLLINYSRYQGIWSQGKINGVTYEFIKTARTKEGESISVKGIYGEHPSGGNIVFLTTNIGIGFIKDLTLDFERGITTDIVLMYRYDSSPEGDGFVLVTTDDVYFDFDNYTN